VSSPRELLEPYLTERALVVSASTVASDLFYLGRFFEFLDESGLSHVGQTTFETLDRYRRQLDTMPGKRGAPLSKAFKQKALQIPRFFLSWSFREGHTLLDFESYPLPTRRLQDSIEVPTVDQVEKLLELPDTSSPQGRRDRLVLESFYTLGLRRRESHRLYIGDLNFTHQTVRVMGKRSRERILPLSDRLCRLLSDYLKNTRPFLRPLPEEQALWISSQTGKRLCFSSLREVVYRNAEKLGLGRVYPHLLRHAAATHMLEAGAKLEQIQVFLGHTVPASTERYAQVTDEELKREHRRSHPRALRAASRGRCND
jgi:integrase/recombinase XerD